LCIELFFYFNRFAIRSQDRIWITAINTLTNMNLQYRSCLIAARQDCRQVVNFLNAAIPYITHDLFIIQTASADHHGMFRQPMVFQLGDDLLARSPKAYPINTLRGLPGQSQKAN
jgi:hypothetical protein